MKKSLLIFAGVAAIFFCFAHEYILLAENYQLKRGDDLILHLFVADGFNIEAERPFQAAPTKVFELMTKDGVTNLSTENGTLPIVKRKVDFEGGGLVHLERDYARISLPTAKFLAYLKEDNIDGIAQKVDSKKTEQKERYTRYIKTLVQSGDNFSDTLYKKLTGQAFEIILLQNPYQLKTGNMLQAKIFFQGKPLANKIITARSRTGSEPVASFTSRTNAKGICSFALSKKGEWFLHATHMIACPDKTDSDWESFWASYSFGIDN